MSVSDLERIELLLAEGMKILNLKSRIQTEHESDTEAWVNLVDLGVSVFCDSEGGTSPVPQTREPTVPGFSVYTTSMLPATHERPGEVDLVIRGCFDRVDAAVAEVFALVVKDTIYGMIENTTILG